MSSQPDGQIAEALITWQEVGEDGTRYALLEGKRGAGTFSYAFFIPAGFWDPPHQYSSDAKVFVVKGCLELSYGDDASKEGLKQYPAGSFVLVPAGATHFDGAHEDTLIIGVAKGPWSTTYTDASFRGLAGTVS